MRDELSVLQKRSKILEVCIRVAMASRERKTARNLYYTRHGVNERITSLTTLMSHMDVQ